MVRRDLLESVGMFDETLTRAQDIHLWYRLAAVTDLVFIPRVLGLYRQRPSTLARRGHSPRVHQNLALRKLLREPALAPWRRQVRAKLALTLADEAAFFRHQGRFLDAAGASLASLGQRPLNGYAWRQLAGSLLRRR
jgi:hypothetical protein